MIDKIHVTPPKITAKKYAKEATRLALKHTNIYPCVHCKWPVVMNKPCNYCGDPQIQVRLIANKLMAAVYD